MKVRELYREELPYIRELHDKFYGKDFYLPDLTQGFLVGFTITNDEDKLIIAGGVRPIAETIIVTDKESHSMITIGRALIKALDISEYVCRRHQIGLLHAFVKNEGYKKHLIQHGFYERDGTALSYNI